MPWIWHSVYTWAPGRGTKKNTTRQRTLWMRLAVGALGHGVTDAGVGVSGGGGGRSREQEGPGGGGGGGNCQRSAM